MAKTWGERDRARVRQQTRVVKRAGKRAWQEWELDDSRTLHLSTGERGLAKMAFEEALLRIGRNPSSRRPGKKRR